MRVARQGARLLLLGVFISLGIAVYPVVLAACRSFRIGRTRWMQGMAGGFLWILGCRVRPRGEISRDGLIVCNHLSYVDILAIGSVCPAVFVAKKDVRDWPVFGLLTFLAGTIYVDRERRVRVVEGITLVSEALSAGLPVVIFPEGTSSDGSAVLPFRAPLLSAAEGRSVTPAAIRYVMERGSVADEVCYWGDMDFVRHVWNLLGRGGFEAHLIFGERRTVASRKLAAEELRALVSELQESLEPPPADDRSRFSESPRRKPGSA